MSSLMLINALLVLVVPFLMAAPPVLITRRDFGRPARRSVRLVRRPVYARPVGGAFA